MRRIGYGKFLLILGMYVLATLPIQVVWAGPPNVVLNRALHFHAPDGTPVTIVPGKYFVEPAGSSELRLIREGNTIEVILQAEALQHEQYELFSPMALTRPAQDDQFFITLFLPGGQKLEAKGSTKAPPRSAVPQPSRQPQAPPAPVTPPPLIETPTPVAPPPLVETPAPATPMEMPIPSPSLDQQPSPAAHSLNYQPPPTDGSQSIAKPMTMPKEGSLGLFVYAPSHLGHTIQEQPTLFWYLSKATSHPVDVMLTEQGEIEVVFDMRLLPPLEAGTHHISLKDYGIRLLKDVPYQWEVKLMTDTPQGMISAKGLIQRVAPSASMPTGIHRDNPTPQAPLLYARSGLWYDAFWALTHLLGDDPHNTTFLAERSTLLTQGGLTLLENVEPTP